LFGGFLPKPWVRPAGGAVGFLQLPLKDYTAIRAGTPTKPHRAEIAKVSTRISDNPAWPSLSSCTAVTAMLLEEKVNRFLAQRLSARFEIEGEFAELAPGDRVEIDRQHALADTARRPCARWTRRDSDRLGSCVPRDRFGRWPCCKEARTLGIVALRCLFVMLA
jgi:hypothetical protein